MKFAYISQEENNMYLTTIENTLPKTIDRLFGDFWRDDFYQISSRQPRMDIHKTENEYEITLEVPGYEQKDISVNVENNTLRISGEIKKEEKNDRKTVHQEISYQTKFERTVSLSNQVDTEKISAKITNGILRVELPLKNDLKPINIKIE